MADHLLPTLKDPMWRDTNLTWSSSSVVPHARARHNWPIAAHSWPWALHGVKAWAHRATHAHVRPRHVAHVHVVPVAFHTTTHAWACTSPNHSEEPHQLVRNNSSVYPHPKQVIFWVHLWNIKTCLQSVQGAKQTTNDCIFLVRKYFNGSPVHFFYTGILKCKLFTIRIKNNYSTVIGIVSFKVPPPPPTHTHTPPKTFFLR